jgi:hypothetical protein
MGSMGNLKRMGPSTLDLETNGVGTTSLAPSNSEVPICERSCHIQRKIEIKPRTAINNMNSRQKNIFC